MKKLFITLEIAFFIVFIIPIYGDMSFQFDSSASREQFVYDDPYADEIKVNKAKYGNLAKEIAVLNTPDDLEEEIIEMESGAGKKTYDISELQIKVMSETYSITHKADGATYKVVLLWDLMPLILASPWLIEDALPASEKTINKNYRINLIDQELRTLQSFNLKTDIFTEAEFTKIELTDINLDGYTDIIVHRRPAVDETLDLYIWDISSKNFTKVMYEGVIALPKFEVFDGYIQIFLRDDVTKIGRTKKMFWEGNHLVMKDNKS